MPVWGTVWQREERDRSTGLQGGLGGTPSRGRERWGSHSASCASVHASKGLLTMGWPAAVRNSERGSISAPTQRDARTASCNARGIVWAHWGRYPVARRQRARAPHALAATFCCATEDRLPRLRDPIISHPANSGLESFGSSSLWFWVCCALC